MRPWWRESQRITADKMKNALRLRNIPALLAVALPVTAMAQTAPARPGAPAPAAARPPAAAASTAAAAAPAPSFVLREINLPQTQAVPRADLQALVQPYIGKPLTNADLRTLVDGVKRLYEERGFGLAAIGLPTQDVTSGTLTLAIVEPRVSRLSVAASESPPLAETRVQRVLGRYGVGNGRDLNVNALDRAMFALNDLPGVAAKATLGASGDEGAYDLVVEVEPRRRWDAQLELDNHGSSSSGKYRLGGVLRWNNPLRIGDNADLRLLFSDGGGVAVGRLGYELPVGYTPARAGVGYSRVDYELGDEFAVLGANGTADVLDASISYPLMRSRGRNLVVRLGGERKMLEDRFDLTDEPIVTPKSVNAFSVGLNYEGRDAWLGGGFSGAALQWRTGRLKFDNRQDADNDADLGDRATGGSFSKVELQLTRLQAVTRELSFHAGLTGQTASKNLDGSEKVTLGGPKGVRAYPKAEGASDEALILTSELRWWLNPRWTVFALVDAARGKSQKRAAPVESTATEAPPDNARTLKGAGFGVYFSDPEWFTVTATLAVRGDELPLAEPGADRRQFFMQLSRAF
jgi:hemolysin activation/secretion protein